jgi:multisubunit Na+/H+ antiporter MnhB subunit
MSDPSREKPSSPGSQRALAAVGAAIILALVAIGIYTWRSLGPTQMDANGYIALILGVLGTVGLGVGLMALLFFSHRYGYDDAAGGRAGPPPDPRQPDKR